MPAGKTYIKIASQTTTSSSNVTFSNIPQNFTDLQIIVSNAQSTLGTPGICLRFNGDTGTNYSCTFVNGTGSAASSARVTNTTYTNVSNNIGLSATSNQPGMYVGTIMNYSNSSTNKTVIHKYSQPLGSAPGANMSVCLWRNTSAITSISFVAETGVFASGTIFTIYGIEAAKNPKADGGNIIKTDGAYWYHAFLSSGLFTPRQNITSDVLVVSGGGAGGSRAAGGGGAGGLKAGTSLSLISGTTYSVTVGAGGTRVQSLPSTRGNTGSSSSFSGSGISTISPNGGGGGGAYPGTAGLVATTGGSGGGGCSILGSTSGAGASGTSGEGNSGGNGSTSAYNGGGGGGAGSSGSNASGSAGGAGGDGSTTYSSWGSATGTGHNVGGTIYYAGGGAGAGGTTSNSNGGGGAGSSTNASATSGTSNTGGGGGGARNEYDEYFILSGSGGSGIIIVRYPV